MRAIILAAGRGSRMQTLTEEQPKCLTELHGKPLLARQIDALQGGGISEIGIVTGYKREKLQPYGLVEFHNPLWETTNMVSSLAAADSWLAEGTCIVSYSDIFYESSAVELLRGSNADIAITHDPDWLEVWSKRFDDPLEDAETFRLDGDRVIEIGNRPRTVSEVEGQYMGLLRFTPTGWAEVQRIRAELPDTERNRTHMTGLLGRIIAAGRVPVRALAYRDGWGEIDTATDLASYQ